MTTAETNPASPHAPLWLRLASAVTRRMPMGRYRVLTRLCRNEVPPFLMRLSKPLGGFACHCDLRDAIAREVFFTGRYEPQETLLLQKFLKPGMTFVDVGANWGYFTMLAAHLVGDGRVISLEPDPRLHLILEENLRRNGLTQVQALSIAAAEQAATVAFKGFDEQGGNWGVSKIVQERTEDPTSFTVEARPLDDVLDDLDIRYVDLLKMDIEGAEGRALVGMQSGLQQHRYRRILLELHPGLLQPAVCRFEDVLNMFTDCGYRGWRINHSRDVSRRVAYQKSLSATDFLAPVSQQTPLDDWPHFLWISPGTDAPE